MHGSLDDRTSIVLTRSDFVRYDARVEPAASVLQAVALRRVGGWDAGPAVLPFVSPADSVPRMTGNGERHGGGLAALADHCTELHRCDLGPVPPGLPSARDCDDDSGGRL